MHFQGEMVYFFLKIETQRSESIKLLLSGISHGDDRIIHLISVLFIYILTLSCFIDIYDPKN